MSSDIENEFFSDGMTEEIINALTGIKGLKVTSRNSSFFFKNKQLPTSEIGDRLKVSTLLEGSIRLSGKRMRISTQLIDVKADSPLWSDTFDRSMDDVFAVQDEISLLVAEKLREHLGHLEIEDHLVVAPDVSPEFYKDYLRSRYLMLKMSKPEIEKGLSILREIITQDPNFAWAHLGMHLGFTLLSTLGYLPAAEGFSKGKPFLDKAIDIDGDMPECQLHLSWLSFLQDWDLEVAYRHLNRVLETRPIVDYYQTMTSILVAEGKTKAAHNYIDIALQLDPFSDINYHLKGFIFYTQQNFVEAIRHFQKSMKLKPGSHVSLLYCGQALLLTGEKKKSLEFFQNLSDKKEELLKLGGMTMAYAAMDEEKNAKIGIAKLESELEGDQMDQALSLLMLCHTLMRNYNQSLDLIERGVANRLPMMVYIFVEPILQPLHSIPRFRELMQLVLGKTIMVSKDDRKYKRSLLSSDVLKKYRRQLLHVMDREKPFLDPNLSLGKLSDILGLPANQLSQLLNEGFDQNFAEFVNAYRLQTFKEFVREPDMKKPDYFSFSLSKWL